MPIAVVDKTFAVLETLSAAERPVPLQELAVPLHMPKPTVYRILQTLIALGYVGQEERTGFYFTTSRLANLGHPNPYQALQRRVRPILDSLYRRFNETVNLGVLEGLHIRYIDVLETTQTLRHVAAPRARDQFTSTAIGRAFVAFLPEDEQDRLIARANFVALTSNTIINPDALKHELILTRKRGWSQESGENDQDLVCFGAPILERNNSGETGQPVAAVSVSLPRFRLNPARKKELTEALAEITRHGTTTNELSAPSPTPRVPHKRSNAKEGASA